MQSGFISKSVHAVHARKTTGRCVQRLRFVPTLLTPRQTHRYTDKQQAQPDEPKSKVAFCRIGYIDTPFCSRDLDLDLVTSICELDLDILKTYLHNKNEVFRLRLSNVRARTDYIHTDRRDWTLLY